MADCSGHACAPEAAFLRETSLIDPADNERDELPSDVEDGPPEIDEEDDGLPPNGDDEEEEEEEVADVAVAATNLPAADPATEPSPHTVLIPPNLPSTANLGSLKVVELKEHLAWRGIATSGDGCSRSCPCPLAAAKVGGSRLRPC
ncbi:hypothetical protein AB1Y20_016674 [Prymnesium parvum]|uniref:Uncharacterized protein n=1 Tax=Prymnesium parvum TaxID=97485 RepID=A0AB34IE31_PRYPA